MLNYQRVLFNLSVRLDLHLQDSLGFSEGSGRPCFPGHAVAARSDSMPGLQSRPSREGH